MSAVAEAWLHLDTGPGAAADNMAFDEALLEAAPRLGRPVLRFYSWSEPAASFGYFQRYADVAAWTALRPLVRRPTAGGLVPHDADWTYSVVFPPGHRWYTLRAVASYRPLHEWLRDAFVSMRIDASLASERQARDAGRCFAGAEQFDLLWQDRKIAGAARRRTRSGLLIQGSVQPPADSDRATWQQAVLDAARRKFGVEWERFEADAELLECAQRFAAEKYSPPGYNRKR